MNIDLLSRLLNWIALGLFIYNYASHDYPAMAFWGVLTIVYFLWDILIELKRK